MNRMAFGLAATVALCVSARAADIALKAPSPPAAIFSWTGFYIGGDFGGTWSRTDASTIQFPRIPAANPADPQAFSLKGTGAIAGLHAGYSWQVAPIWILGVEGDADWTEIRASVTAPLMINGLPSGGFPGISSSDRVSRNVNWLASIRGRAGYVHGSWLLYATAGGAWGGLQQSATQSLNAPGVSVIWPFSSSTTASGWVAGAGVEHVLSNHWTMRGEYLYYSLTGTTGNALPMISGSVVVPGNFFADTFARTTIQTARLGISYKFGGPVLAGY